MKNYPQKKLMTDEEMMHDGERWLNEIDKKFLGMKTAGNGLKLEPVAKKIVRAFDDVSFDDLEIYDRYEVLRKESPTREINEEVEDKWLITIRPSHEFKMYFL